MDNRGFYRWCRAVRPNGQFMRIVALALGSSVWGIRLGNVPAAIAEPETPMMEQVSSVSQLSDVQPTDWAFQAVQALVERYGCIAGYPNQTFQGQRSLTRHEFAAGINACLDRINQILAASTTDLVTQADLQALQKLQAEFAVELATLRGRADGLEAQTTTLEKQQFSTTTKLIGQVIFAANAGGFDGSAIVDPNGVELANDNPNATVLYRVALDLDTSFTGTDLLKIRIDTGSNGIRDNAAGVLEPTFGSVLDYSVKPPTNNTFGIGRIYYTFKPFKDITVSLGPDIRTTDYIDANSYAYLSFRNFSTLAFANNYILFPINGPSAGAFVQWNPGGGPLRLRAMYAAADPANPGEDGPLRGVSFFTRLLYPNGGGAGTDRGLFGDTYEGLAEVEYAPSKAFTVRLQYGGGEVYDNRFDVLGANFELRLSLKVAVFGRYGYGSYQDTDFGDINPQYWMAGVAFPDLLKRGAIAGIAAGQPFITDDIGDATQTNFEAFYNFPINDYIRVTPLIQVITNAGNQDSNGTILTGTIRTVFTF